jgi:hypothetical protein
VEPETEGKRAVLLHHSFVMLKIENFFRNVQMVFLAPIEATGACRKLLVSQAV